MSAEAIAKRIKYIFMLCLFSGLCGLGHSVFGAIRAHSFMGLPLSALLIIAEGVIFWRAFQSDSLEKAMNQISALRIMALVLAAYSVYSLVMHFVRAAGSFHLFMIWYEIVSDVSAFCASLAVCFTAAALKAGDTKKFNSASALLLAIDVVLVLCVSAAALIVSEYPVSVLMGIVLLVFLFAVAPKMLGNQIVRGAIIGRIAEGDAGTAADAAAGSGDKKEISMNTNEKEKELVSSRPKTPSKGIAAGAVLLFGGLVMEILAFSGALGGTTYYKDGVKTGFTPSAGWVLFGIVLIAVGSLVFYNVKKGGARVSITEHRLHAVLPNGACYDIPLSDIQAVEKTENSVQIRYSDENKNKSLYFTRIANASEIYAVIDGVVTETQEKNRSVDFYLKCVEQGIEDASTRSQIEKIKLVAQNNSYEGDEAVLLEKFKQGKAIYSANEKAKRLSEIVSEESRLEEENTRYIDYCGTDKSAAICIDNANEYRAQIGEAEKRITSAQKSADGILRAGTQKEQSWAVHGGIASGIAGGAAGLAVAADVERRNQAIRQQNAQLSRSVAAMSLAVEFAQDKKIRNAKDMISYWERREEEYRNKLVENLPQEELLEKLAPAFEEIRQSESGAVSAAVKTQPAPVVIFGDVKAVVDGSVKAILYSGGKAAAHTCFALPLGGAREALTTNIVFRDAADSHGDYSIRFEAYHLWAVEE